MQELNDKKLHAVSARTFMAMDFNEISNRDIYPSNITKTIRGSYLLGGFIY